jgi:hypothetical protein
MFAHRRRALARYGKHWLLATEYLAEYENAAVFPHWKDSDTSR